MKKSIAKNIKYLEGLGRNSKDKAKVAILHAIELYSQRRIPNMTTVQNLILALRSPNKSMANKALREYDRLAVRDGDAEPLPEKHVRLKRERMEEVKIARSKMSAVMNKICKTKLPINISKVQEAMNGQVVDYTVQFGFMGSIISNDLAPVLARSYLLVKRALYPKRTFKFYATIKLWSHSNNAFKPDVYSGEFPSNETAKWMTEFIGKIEGVIQRDDGTVLKHSLLKFHIIYQPQGAGRATDSWKRESIYKKTSVVQKKRR